MHVRPAPSQPAPRAAAPVAPAPAPAPGSALQMQLTRCLGALAVAAADTRSDPSRLTLDALVELLRALGLTLESAAGLDAGRAAGVAAELVGAVNILLHDPQIGQRLEDRTASVGPVVALGGLLPEPVRKLYFNDLAKAVITGLNTPRALGTSRTAVFAFAEVFGRLIDVGHLPISGAVVTICRLLATPEKRMAAVTMLGKTVEVCFMQLSERCDAASLAELHTALRSLTEPEFQYDVEYVCDCMGWTHNPPTPPAPTVSAPAPAPASAPAQQKAPPKQQQQPKNAKPAAAAAPVQPPAQQAQKASPVGAANGSVQAESSSHEASQPAYTGDALSALQPVSSRVCRYGHLYALAVDSTRGETFVAVHNPSEAEPDVTQVWNAAGLACEINMGAHLCSHLDVMRPVSVMLAATMSKSKAQSTSSCYVRCFAPNDDGLWVEAGALARPEARPLAALRALPTTDGYSFALGDKHRPAGSSQAQEVVSIFDLSASQSFASLQPVQTFAGHTALVTALEVAPLSPKVLLSGSKDSTVRLWDRRMPDGRGLIVAGAATAAGPGLGHRDMITSLAVRDVSVLSSSMDCSVMLWDLRTIGGGPGGSSQPVSAWRVDGKPVIKVALCQGAPCGAAATTHGLFALDVGGAALAGARGAQPPPQRQVTLPSEGQRAAGKYHCAAWDPLQGLLHAGWTTTDASMSGRLDTFRAVAP